MTDRSKNWRRAAKLVLLAIVGIAALLPALAWLRQARARHAGLSALTRTPLRTRQPVLAPGIAFHGTASAAEATLGATIRELATREATLVEQVAPRPALARSLVARHAIISGSAHAILHFTDAIESRTPVVRLARYHLVTNASGRSLRLEADFVMAFVAP